jgi:hypothetical protein
MRVVAVVPSRRWLHTSGRTASLFGAVPWTGAAGDQEQDWSLEQVGFTWEMSNGTIGMGRIPAKTRQEAERVMAQVNGR